eukprot:m.42505 g.42505  ORF g.42505 m.42505 type:complete len:262 (+) comp9887_c0_seq2:266-1051(+)
MKFQIVKDSLFVTLGHGEAVRCESDAAVTYSPNIHVTGEMTKGLLSAMARNMLTGETFFMQILRCVEKNGQAMVAPKQIGDVHVIEEVADCPLLMSPGAFLAAGEHVNISSVTQNIVGAMFSGTGLFILEARGVGPVAFSGFGTIIRRDLEQGQEMIVDNGHILAWDATTRYNIELANRNSILSSVTSGEALVCRFTGPGSIWIQTRNTKGFKQWLNEDNVKKGGSAFACMGFCIVGMMFCLFFMIIIWLATKKAVIDDDI